MKVFRRDDFLKLPVGTLFVYSRPGTFGEFSDLCAKGKTTSNNWELRELNGAEWEDDGNVGPNYARMAETGESAPINSEFTSGRGPEDEVELFLVYEVNDLAELIRCATDAIIASKP